MSSSESSSGSTDSVGGEGDFGLKDQESGIVFCRKNTESSMANLICVCLVLLIQDHKLFVKLVVEIVTFQQK